MMEHTMPTENPQKKRGEDVWKKKDGMEDFLVLNYVGRTDGACLMALLCVQTGHFTTCLPQTAQSID